MGHHTLLSVGESSLSNCIQFDCIADDRLCKPLFDDNVSSGDVVVVVAAVVVVVAGVDIDFFALGVAAIAGATVSCSSLPFLTLR